MDKFLDFEFNKILTLQCEIDNLLIDKVNL